VSFRYVAAFPKTPYVPALWEALRSASGLSKAPAGGFAVELEVEARFNVFLCRPLRNSAFDPAAQTSMTLARNPETGTL
jgi:hypothetical protein